MWRIYFGNNNKCEMIDFFLLPSIEYFRDKTFDENGDCSFNISFSWLFWSLTFSRYWGSVYKK